MSKLTRQTNFRVTIEPRSKGDFGSVRTNMFGEYTPEEQHRTCGDIASAIKRISQAGLVDDIGRVFVEGDTEHVCEHCGSIWTEDSLTYNGGCCAKDEDSNPVTPSNTEN